MQWVAQAVVTGPSPDGSHPPGEAGVVMVSAPDEAEAKEQAATLLKVDVELIRVAPL